MIYFTVYLAVMVIMSASSKENSLSSFQSSSLDICIIDHDESRASAALTDYLSSRHNRVTLRRTDKEYLQDCLFYEKINYVLTIPDGFEEKLLSGKTQHLTESAKQKDSAKGYFADQQIDQYLNSVYLYLCGGYDIADAIDKTNASISSLEEVTLVQFEETGEAKNNTMFYFFQYIPYIMLLLILMGMAPILITFNQPDLHKRMECSALSLRSRTIQISLACIAFCLTAWILFMAAAAIIFGPAMLFCKTGMLCILNSLVYALIATAITLLISSFSPPPNVLNMIGNAISLGMSFLCGVFVPQSYLSSNVLAVSRFLPAYWYVRINNMLAGFSDETLSMDTYWLCIGVQFGFLAAIFALYLVISRQNRQE